VSRDYGNARIAARRARLLDPATLRHLAAAASPAEFVATLERHEDWRSIVRQVAALGAETSALVDGAIERHRSDRLAALPRLFEPPDRALVEALVLPLDASRALAVLRRRHAGESAESIGSTIVGGALLGPADLGRLARASSAADAVGVLVRAGVVDAAAAPRLVDAAGQPDGWARFEERLGEAFEHARHGRARARGRDAGRVRGVLAGERATRAAVADALVVGGAAAAALVERTETLARLDALARDARRDPLGIGPVIAYAAAIEAQAIRLRAALARVCSGWTSELARPYLGWSAA
jgi:vacuolar-type H+-ATPase subunit C/Vma6